MSLLNFAHSDISINGFDFIFLFYFIWNTSCSQDNTRKSYNDLFPVWSIADVWGFRVGGGVHDSYTFQCGLVGSFTSPGIDTR